MKRIFVWIRREIFDVTSIHLDGGSLVHVAYKKFMAMEDDTQDGINWSKWRSSTMRYTTAVEAGS